MPAKKKTAATKRPARAPAAARLNLEAALELLERKGTKATRDSLVKYGIHVDRALGVTVGTLRQIAKSIGHDHELADELWQTGWYEARLLATMIDDPAQVSAAQMDRWCRDFDNWGIVDTACFALFDRTAHAWKKVHSWCGRSGEWQKRAGFALLWSLTVHDPRAPDAEFLKGLALIEQHANDERHFVKKAINMALRATGKRNAALNEAALVVARRLAASKDPHARWVGQDAVRELSSAKVQQWLARKKPQRGR
jgi:3-methyladenine DNA glycosylase AlkD